MNRRKMLGAVAVAPVAVAAAAAPAKAATPKIEIDCIYGYAPVQARGRIDGRVFYFRARWDHWKLEVSQRTEGWFGAGPVDADDDWDKGLWSYQDIYPGGEAAASWMDHEEARRLIHLAAEAYAKRA